MYDPLYYCIIRTADDEKLLTVVTMQPHDEYDYDYNRFLFHKGTSDRVQFLSEEKAIKFLNDNIKPEHIDPEYLVQTQKYNDSFYKDE